MAGELNLHHRPFGANLALLQAFSIGKPLIRPSARNNVIQS
jgi:hypothetical protein